MALIQNLPVFSISLTEMEPVFPRTGLHLAKGHTTQFIHHHKRTHTIQKLSPNEPMDTESVTIYRLKAWPISSAKRGIWYNLTQL
jgi:hypothetical protein